MGTRRRIIARAASITLLLGCLMAPALAHADDTGLNLSAEVQKKLTKKASLSAEVEYRTRNDFRTTDRFGFGLGAAYKPLKWLKADAGYVLLLDNNPEKISLHEDGTTNNWRPSYHATRHRFYIGVTGSYRIGRFDLSLRERYQITYRPEHNTKRYDFDNLMWEPTVVKSKTRHILRSRLKAEYDIPASKFSPWASVELFNDLRLDKVRLQAGCDYTLKKQHQFSLFYRYQRVTGTDNDGETNSHILGAGYCFKF